MTPWKKIDELPLFTSEYKTLIKKIFELPDGRVSDFTIKKEGAAVCVLALTPENNVVLAKQFRPGPEKILLEMPGGSTEKGAPEKAIQRELLEETGYTGEVEFVGTTLCDAYSTRIRYNFVARNCIKTQEPTPEENEFIEVVEISLQDFREHLRSGELTDVESGYLCLDYLGLL